MLFALHTFVLFLLSAGSAHAEGGGPQILRDCPECPELIAIPKGRFTMGEPEADSQNRRRGWGGPPVTVTLVRSFALARTETTQAQFDAFVRATGYTSQGDCKVGRLWPEDAARAKAADHPAVCIGYGDAQAYLRWLNTKARDGRVYRLPSEAEFEYAARAGTTAPYPWPGGLDRICAYANVADRRFAATGTALPTLPCDDGFAFAAPVASYPANAFGIHDLLGNAWEWVDDCGSDDDLITYPKDGTPLRTTRCATSRATRGGGFVSNDWWMRVTTRGGGHDVAATYNPTVGFRVAATLP